ncbi:MAG: hypothetical protein E6899_06670 [Neisseria sp.]|jgi:hypothetical protein|uniref:hypothetical protein n=1 Tax=Neisseria sp. HMSC074B07 TaxID=1715205 RepID=UPI0011D14169|nr:hypothetical protein [Neisseria sp. HMSC074B07]MDU1534521.1 hypothetical protein [Neisseria sp.]
MMDKGINKALLRQVIQTLERERILKSNLSIEDYKVHFTQIILKKMSQSNDCWLSICPFNYHYIGESFEKRLNFLEKNWDSEILDDIFLMSIRFLREAELTMRRQYKQKLWNDDDTYERIWDWFKSLTNDDIHYNQRFQLNYIQNDYSLMLLNDYLGNKLFQAFLNHEENIKKIEQQSITLKETSNKIQKNFDEEMQKSVDEKLEKVEQLSDTLENLKQGFNFVALSDGFSRMLNEKKSSKKWILRLLFLIAVIISAIPTYKFFSDGGINLTWQQIAISAGLELVLIYFFRVVLFHYRTVQTQIMQLDLRLSLCQFIQSYAEYAKEIKTNDKDALDKFENLIFSSILSSDEKIPSTFDGLEQLNSLIKQFKQ